MAFAQSYLPGTPAGTDIANQLDTFIQNFKVSNNERIALEHRDLDTGNSNDAADDAQGRHIPGFVSAVLIDTFANIDALTKGGATGVHKGAQAFSTDDGVYRLFDGTDWTSVIVGGVLGGATVLKTGTFPGNVTDGSGGITQSGFTVDPVSNQADWNEVIDLDDTELTTTGTIAANTTALIFVDLGSAFIGTIRTLMNVTHAGGGDQLSLNHVWAFDNSGVITGTGGTRLTQGTGGGAAGEQSPTLSHFYGRFVGIELQNTNGSNVASINLARFEIHGVSA